MSLTLSIEQDALPRWATSSLSNCLITLISQLREDRGADLDGLLGFALDYAAEAEQTIAAQTARIAELEALSLTDELTGLANRRAFERAFAQALGLAERHDETGVVIVFDLDHFKPVNDTYGHDAGDAVLRHTARLLRSGLRATDVLARIGGDEFAAVLLRADPVAGMAQGERLQALVDASPLLWRGARLRAQMSYGACAFGAGDDPDTVLRAADQSMYLNKRERRPQAAQR